MQVILVLRDPYETFLLSLMEDIRLMWELADVITRRHLMEGFEEDDGSEPEASDWSQLGPGVRQHLVETALADIPMEGEGNGKKMHS